MRTRPKLVLNNTVGIAASVCRASAASAMTDASSTSHAGGASIATTKLPRTRRKQRASNPAASRPFDCTARGAMTARNSAAPKLDNKAATNDPRTNARASPLPPSSNDGQSTGTIIS
jgi:hypothetical protein